MKDLIPYLDEKVEEYIIFSGLADSTSIDKYSGKITDISAGRHKSYLGKIYIKDKLKEHFGISSDTHVNNLGLKILRGESRD